MGEGLIFGGLIFGRGKKQNKIGGTTPCQPEPEGFHFGGAHKHKRKPARHHTPAGRIEGWLARSTTEALPLSGRAQIHAGGCITTSAILEVGDFFAATEKLTIN